MADAATIDALLPQTQCTRCGYPTCREYAEAISAGEASINQCPPGGTETIIALAQLLGRDPLPLNKDNGLEHAPKVAFIDEDRCIGCTKCLPPCPVDAIAGARQRMHTVIAELCTGCELCVAPCPVDCIIMIPLLKSPVPSLALPPAQASRERFEAHNARVERRSAERAAVLAEKKRGARPTP